MKKVFFLIVFSLLFSYLCFADNAQLTLISLKGDVEVSLAGGDWQKAKVDQALNSADKIRTQNGTAEIRFADGSTVKLRENTSLDLVQIKSSSDTQNSMFKLLMGNIKAKVTKLKEGASFEVHSTKVIAAVKGTEFVMGTTNEEIEVLVIEGIVALMDITREKEVFIKENEKAAFKDGLFTNPREMSPDEQKSIKDSFDTGMKPSNAPGIMPSPDREGLDREIRDLKMDLAQIKDRSNLEDKQDLLERISDVQLGKSAMDMHGYRVRTDNYVLRPQADTIQMLNITKREGGPDKGISSFEINEIYNKPLPENFMDVKIALKIRADWFDKNTKPEYFLNQQISAIRNPHGDVIMDEVTLEPPLFNNDVKIKMWEQPFAEKFLINDAQKWIHNYTYNSGVFTEDYIDNMDVHHGTNLPYTVTMDLTKDGGFVQTDTYADNSFLKKYMYLVDDTGSVHDVLKVFQETGASFGSSLLTYNWELIYSATEFGGRTIDIIVLPEIFNELF